VEARPVETVAESPSEIWRRIEGAFKELGGGIVEGEVQRCTRAGSGHVYIDLTDGEARISCVIWADAAAKIIELPREGQLIQARYRRVRTYAKGGSVSLECDAIRGAGEGELLQRVLDVRERLRAEGLTDPERKLPLPRFPRRVGLVTGRDSDAEADVIRSLRDRFPPTRITVCHSLVQGVGAVNDIIAALGTLAALPDVDVIILARGGGSVEDLLPFSDEALCRAISALGTPVVTSIGHTKQRPNCDEVASAAAEVPARAAEHVVPSAAELRERIDRRAADALGYAAARLTEAGGRVERSAMRPAGQAALLARTGRLDLAGQTLSHATGLAAGPLRERIAGASLVVQQALTLLPRPASLDVPRERLGLATAGVRHALELRAATVVAATSLIRARDWRERGFALVRLPDGALVRDAATLTAGQHIAIELQGATLAAVIETVHPEATETDQ
jgi:exodeoxyribonuclease VII large subunit